MAHRVLRRYPRSFYKGSKEVKQHFRYLLALDFEATCEKNVLLQPQEIIEFPCMAVSTDDWKVKQVFHEYVKPRVHPELSTHCTDLTGIIQDMVDKQPHFPEVFEKFCAWLNEHGYFGSGNESAFVTCGDWDLRAMLPQQCALDDLRVPEPFQQWINLKQSFNIAMYYYPRSLKDMLSRLNLPLKGKLHSGINDTENMINIIRTLQQQRKIQFEITSTAVEPKVFVDGESLKAK